MAGLRPWFKRIASDLSEAAAKFAVVGGMAVAVRVEPRFTRDIDLAVSVPDDPEAERILRSLILRGYRPVAEFDRNDRPRLATMRLKPPGSTIEQLDAGKVPIIDLIFASCGIEPEVVMAALPLMLFRHVVAPVAQVPHLIAMKVLSHSERRPQDLLDLQSLIVGANAAELHEARRLVQLIEERGYHNNRSLVAELAALVERFRK